MTVQGDFCIIIKRIRKVFQSFLLKLVAFLFLTLQANGQEISDNDTVKISEVVISRNNTFFARSFFAGTKIDSSSLGISGHENIATLISDNTNISFKSYGGGGSATISIRGTGAGHTQLEWNGISINHPMLGQADYSLVPVFAADGIHIFYGSSSMQNNSGGIGGIVNLETLPVWTDKTSVNISAGAGSFGSFSGSAGLRTGNLIFQTHTKAFINSSENDFTYLNSETNAVPSWEKMEENRVRSRGLIQELYYRSSKSLLSARFWYQSSDRELPSSMLTRQPGLHEKQFDESFRTMFSYNLKSRANSFSFTGALITNKLDYLNNLAAIDSRNRSGTVVLKAGIENTTKKDLKLYFLINEELTSVRSNNYEGGRKRNLVTVTASAEKTFFSKMRATLLAREIVDGQSLLTPDYSAGLQYKIFQYRDYYLKASIARNSKLPSMNDLFWYPGGNSNLQNEWAMQYEISYDMACNPGHGLSFNYDIAAFIYEISDMIVWHPGEFSYWTADNIKNANSSGFETSFKINYTLSRLVTKLKAGYSFTRSVSHVMGGVSTNYQLPYIPVNQAYVSLSASSGVFYSTWDCNYTGYRYTTSDNSGFLPGYFLNSLSAGAKLSGNANSMDICFRIDNLLNQSYQAIAHYPMPGRAYFLKLSFNITK